MGFLTYHLTISLIFFPSILRIFTFEMYCCFQFWVYKGLDRFGVFSLLISQFCDYMEGRSKSWVIQRKVLYHRKYFNFLWFTCVLNFRGKCFKFSAKNAISSTCLLFFRKKLFKHWLWKKILLSKCIEHFGPKMKPFKIVKGNRSSQFFIFTVCCFCVW